MIDFPMKEVISKQYRRIIDLRNEGFRKYGCLFPHQFVKVPSIYTRPHLIINREDRSRIHELGLRHYDLTSRICVLHRPVPWVVGQRLVKNGDSLLDIGCSDGMFYKFLEFNKVSPRYSGLETDESVRAGFPLFRSINEIHSSFRIITMFHVIEHMTLDQSLRLLQDATRLLSDGILVLATPNILSPGVFDRDIDHKQPFPWYDLYAILRLFFKSVDVVRGLYLSTPTRAMTIPMRVVLGTLTEQDWCEEIILVARGLNRTIDV